MNTKHIKFSNNQYRRSQFDLIRLEELFLRTELDHSPVELHKVEFYVILIIEQGKTLHTIDFIDYDCKKGTLITIRKDQIHKFHKGQNVKGSLLLFTDEFLITYLEDMEVQKTMLLFNELLHTPKLQLSSKNLKDILQKVSEIKEEYFSIKDKHSLSIIRSELHILITMLFRLKEKSDSVDFDKKYLTEFISLQKLIEENVTQTKAVKDYAKMMGRSSKTLNTICRSIVHKPAKEFIDEICTKQIKRLLINTELSIKEIAFKSGFEETTNFFKYFKRQTKVTPEQFRENNSHFPFLQSISL